MTRPCTLAASATLFVRGMVGPDTPHHRRRAQRRLRLAALGRARRWPVGSARRLCRNGIDMRPTDTRTPVLPVGTAALAPFVAAGILHEAGVQVAGAVARAVSGTSAEVLLATALCVRAPRVRPRLCGAQRCGWHRRRRGPGQPDRTRQQRRTHGGDRRPALARSGRLGRGVAELRCRHGSRSRLGRCHWPRRRGSDPTARLRR